MWYLSSRDVWRTLKQTYDLRILFSLCLLYSIMLHSIFFSFLIFYSILFHSTVLKAWSRHCMLKTRGTHSATLSDTKYVHTMLCQHVRIMLYWFFIVKKEKKRWKSSFYHYCLSCHYYISFVFLKSCLSTLSFLHTLFALHSLSAFLSHAFLYIELISLILFPCLPPFFALQRWDMQVYRRHRKTCGTITLTSAVVTCTLCSQCRPLGPN